MAVVKWNPIRELEDMRKDLNKLFEEFADPDIRGRFQSKRVEPGTIIPHVDMLDRKAEIVVRAELPGVEKDNIDLTMTKEALTIKGEVKKDEELQKEDYYLSERRYGSFSRTLPLPVEIDSSKVKAHFRNGVLEIVLPKKEDVKPQEIKVDIN
ncbi:MAG: Hsp20/alpha crystallin family protein [Nitrospirota bacterium]|nr:Hsp20/alpha crystallin family protein [Nitrospirota bacterium]